jgi:hypothetical protein
MTTSKLGLAHIVSATCNDEATLARMNDYIGQYVCVHSAPSAWYGIMVGCSVANGIPSCDLADAGLWTQGMTKDLVRPGQKSTDDLQARRDGVITVMAITAIQPAGAFSEQDDKVKDQIKLRSHRVRTPAEQGICLEQFAEFMGQEPHLVAGALLEVYHKSAPAKKKSDENPRGNFSAVIGMIQPYAETKDFPVRGIAGIVLHGARKYVW